MQIEKGIPATGRARGDRADNRRQGALTCHLGQWSAGVPSGTMHSVSHICPDTSESDIRPAQWESKRSNSHIAGAYRRRRTTPAMGGRGHKPGACQLVTHVVTPTVQQPNKQLA